MGNTLIESKNGTPADSAGQAAWRLYRGSGLRSIRLRITLAHMLVSIGIMAVAIWPATVTSRGSSPEPIGFSQGGLPLMVYRIGDGPRTLLILGAQHGGPEVNTYRLVQSLLEHFTANPAEIPNTVTMAILPETNPDGLAAGTRRFLSGVDPNRNWGSPDWDSDGYDSNGRFERGLGGPEPFSEQETRALGDWILRTRPALVINYHSAGGFMFGGGRGPLGAELADAFGQATGYYRPQPGGGPRVLGYRASGTTSGWLNEQGVSGIFIELTNAADPEFNRNLAGVRAVLEVLGRG